MPMIKSAYENPSVVYYAHPHRAVKCSCNLIVRLKSRATTKDFWQPELTNSTLHMLDLAVTWGRSLDPLAWLPTDTAHHIGMGESLRSRPIVGLRQR